MAGFGGVELYPGFLDKAAVLVVRLAKNHALPDGNKRCAWVLLRLFVELNGWAWDPYPSVDEAEASVIAVASGDWREEQMAVWLAGTSVRRTNEPGGDRRTEGEMGDHVVPVSARRPQAGGISSARRSVEATLEA